MHLRQTLHIASHILSSYAVVERVSENEAVKMIRVKEGLVRMGMSYCDLAQRCLILFTAHQAIAAEMPDVHDKDLHDIKYTGEICTSLE